MPTFVREMRDELQILVVGGELDISTQEQFAEALRSIDASLPRVLIDFCRCSYFDSSALTELVRFRNTRAKIQQVLLAVTSPNAKRILEISGLDRAFEFGDCVHQAVVPLDRPRRAFNGSGYGDRQSAEFGRRSATV